MYRRKRRNLPPDIVPPRALCVCCLACGALVEPREVRDGWHIGRDCGGEVVEVGGWDARLVATARNREQRIALALAAAQRTE